LLGGGGRGERVVERLSELIGRAGAGDQLVTDDDGRGRLHAGVLGAVDVGQNHGIDPVGRDAAGHSGGIDTNGCRQRVEDGAWVGTRRPARLGRKEGIVHGPELALCARTHRHLGRREGVGVHLEGEIEKGDADFAVVDVVVLERGERLVVPLLAVGALEVAGHDHPDFRGRVAFDARLIDLLRKRIRRGGSDGDIACRHAPFNRRRSVGGIARSGSHHNQRAYGESGQQSVR
jgi:hypothetical protein